MKLNLFFIGFGGIVEIFTNDFVMVLIALIISIALNIRFVKKQAGAIGIIGKVNVSAFRFLIANCFPSIIRLIVVFVAVLIMLLLFRSFIVW